MAKSPWQTSHCVRTTPATVVVALEWMSARVAPLAEWHEDPMQLVLAGSGVCDAVTERCISFAPPTA